MSASRRSIIHLLRWGRNDPRPRTPLWGQAAIAIVLLAGLNYVTNHAVVTLTRSVNYRLYWPDSTPALKGDYAWFEIEHADLGKGPKRLTKRIGCEAGDYLTYQAPLHFCNGVLLDQVMPARANGDPIEAFVYDGLIPEGQVYMVGDISASLDSRYFGLVQRSALHHVQPVF